MRAPRLTTAFLALSLAGCATFPELDATVSDDAKSADYPRLMPVSELTAAAPEARITEQAASSLNGRVSALRARAARLRGSVVDSATKRRMRAGVTAPDSP